MKSNLLKFITLFSFIFLCVFTANAQSGTGKNKSLEGEQTKDTPLKIIKKEPPRVSIFGQCFEQYGMSYVKVMARVAFDKSGVVTDIEIIKASDCREFDEESLRVAKRIKFKPAMRDGEAITITKTVVYEGGIR